MAGAAEAAGGFVELVRISAHLSLHIAEEAVEEEWNGDAVPTRAHTHARSHTRVGAASHHMCHSAMHTYQLPRAYASGFHGSHLCFMFEHRAKWWCYDLGCCALASLDVNVHTTTPLSVRFGDAETWCLAAQVSSFA